MNRLLLILASGAVAGGVLTSALVLAQAQGPVVPDVDARQKDREAWELKVTRKTPNLEAVLKHTRRRQIVNLANQLRPIYRYELMSVRTACGLTPDQFRSIRAETDAAFDSAIARLYEAQQNAPQSMPVRPADLDYETVIREAVGSVARRQVPAERWAAYQDDLRRREASRKQAGAEFLVATIDRDLQLTGRQRDQLTQSLAAHWDNRWYSALELTLAGRPCAPRIPDELVKPYLSEAQQAIWSAMYHFEGPLWGVALDHGGGPDMESALGAIPEVGGRGAVRAERSSRSVPKKALNVEPRAKQ